MTIAVLAYGHRAMTRQQDMSPTNRERWHVGKEIPLALIVMLMIQTGTGIWWAATQSAKLDSLAVMMSDFKSTQYTQADNRRDMAVIAAQHMEFQRRLEALERQRR